MSDKPVSVIDFLGEQYHAMAKEYAKANGVNVPVLLSRLAIHVMTSDDASSVITDLCQDAPRAGKRGRAALPPEERAARAAQRAVKASGASADDQVLALQRAIDALRKG